MKHLLIIITSLLIIPNSLAFFQITEIMYDPLEQDNNNEYIEILTDLNLENFSIQDSKEEDTLILIKKTNSNYSLIVEEDFNHTNINSTIYTTGKTIGNNLNNNEDILILKNQSEVLDAIHYYSYWGADGNGNSLCLLNKRWEECIPTPGAENKKQEKEYKIKINEFLPDPVGNDNAPTPDGEWIELINLDGEVDIENFYFKDSSNKKFYIAKTNTETTVIKDYLVVYTNGFPGLLNNEGIEKIQFFDLNNNLIDEVSYSFTKEGISWSRIDEKWMETVPTPNKENSDNKEEFESRIDIEKIYLGNDNKANFGDIIRVKIEIYKGDTNRESISAWIEKDSKKISKTTSFNVEEKFKKSILTIPIQIFPNCDGKFKGGEYIVKVEGLGKSDGSIIDIEGITKNLCNEILAKSNEQDIKLSETNINEQESTLNRVVYESKGRKSNGLAIYFFTLVLILVIIQMITEKWKK